MFGHLFDDEPRAGGAGGSGSEDEDSLLSSGEEEEEEGSDGPDGWSEEEEGDSGSEEEGAGGRGRGRRRQPDELDELFGQVRMHCSGGGRFPCRWDACCSVACAADGALVRSAARAGLRCCSGCRPRAVRSGWVALIGGPLAQSHSHACPRSRA